MNFAHWLVLLSAAINIVGFSAYIRDTYRGKTKPNKVSWGLWALAPLIGTFAALSSDADIWATSRVFLAGFLPLIVFIVSFMNKKSFWKLTFFDFLCGIYSVLALIAWNVIGSPLYAILLSIAGDAFAALPTLRKSWNHPETETGITYVASLISVVLILPSIPVWNIENSGFLIQLLIQNIVLVIAVYRKHIF